ncbi:MAG: phosphotransacetylase, partial [Mycoplasmatales bacterium]
PEGDEDRVIGALKYVDNIKFVLLGNKVVILEKITKMYKKNYDEIMDKVEIIDQDDMVREDLLKIFVEKRHGKINEDLARELMKERNYFATLLLEAGEVNGLVGGCVYSTADILKPAFQIIKPAPGNSTVSSVFVLKKGDEKLLFADCAVNIEPTKVQLKEIVRQTIGTAREMGIKPKVAMLSYSTKGSGNGHYVDLVRTAYEELIIETPEFKDLIDGELQFDAAYVPKVGNQKAPGSPVAGRANVFVFPHLNSGNIAYKMAQYLGGYEAVGPLLQGLNRPVNDLSRGTDAVTIAKVAYLALRKY